MGKGMILVWHNAGKNAKRMNAMISVQIIGEAFYAMPVGAEAFLDFDVDSLTVSFPPHQTRQIHYAEITDLKIYGPGKISSGGGFAGGGLGVDGALAGIVASAALNALTTKTSFQTFLSIETLRGEMHFLCPSCDPQVLRIELAHTYTRMRQLDRTQVQSVKSNVESLLNEGLISEDQAEQILLNATTRFSSLPSSGYKISFLAPEGRAKEAGIQNGDRIVQYGEKEIHTDDDLACSIKSATSAVDVLLVRGQKLLLLKVLPGRLGIEGEITG